MAAPLTTLEETTVVALLARGETYAKIRTHFKETYNKPLSGMAVTAVKKRNLANIRMLQEKVQEKVYADAVAIKTEANQRISERLKADGKGTAVYDQLYAKFLNGDITFKEFQDATKIIPKSFFMTTAELVAVSKEMHVQSRGDDAPTDNPVDTSELAKAIQAGDTLTIQQLIFKRGDNVEPGQFTQ